MTPKIFVEERQWISMAALIYLLKTSSSSAMIIKLKVPWDVHLLV